MNQLSFQTGTSLVAAPGAAAKLSSDEERRRRELEEARLRADAEFRSAEEKRRVLCLYMCVYRVRMLLLLYCGPEWICNFDPGNRGRDSRRRRAPAQGGGGLCAHP